MPMIMPMVTFGSGEPGHPYLPVYLAGRLVALGIGGMMIDQRDAERIARAAAWTRQAMPRRVVPPEEVEMILMHGSRPARRRLAGRIIGHVG